MGELTFTHSLTVAGLLHSTTDSTCFNGRLRGTSIDRRGNIAHAGMAHWNRVLSEAEINAIYDATAGA